MGIHHQDAPALRAAGDFDAEAASKDKNQDSTHFTEFSALTVAWFTPPPSKKLLTQKNSWGIIFGVIATLSRNQLRKIIL